VLIDDQLVLTAGHCTPDDGACDDQRIVFDHAITDPSQPVAIDADAVHRCRSVAVRAHDIDAGGHRRDYAVIELDRPVGSARRPAELSGAPPPAGSDVTVIGCPSGLPAKVDPGPQLLYARPCGDHFTLDSDTFEATSGSGVFDDRGQLAGLFVRGGIDYEFVPDRGCAVVRRIADVTDPTQAEQAGYVTPAITALCASGWPSARLCAAAPAPIEDAASCPPEDPAAGETSGGCDPTSSVRLRSAFLMLPRVFRMLRHGRPQT
jgi:hypothetical protein